MEMVIDFPGGARVDAHFGGFTVCTDQPPQGGGEGSAPTPFALFLASLGTCAGIYVVGFCRQRGLDTQGIRLVQKMGYHPETGKLDRVHLDIQLPPGFPEKYPGSPHPRRQPVRREEAAGQPPDHRGGHLLPELKPNARALAAGSW